MKVLFLTDHYPPYVKGGAEINCALIAEEMARRGHQVNVLTTFFGVSKPSIEGFVYRSLYFPEITSKNAWERRINHARLFISSLKNNFITRRMITQFRPDIAFTWNFEYDSLLSSIFVFQEMRLPNLFSINSHWPIHLNRNYELEENLLSKWYRSALIGFRRFKDLKFQGAIFVSQTILDDCEKAGIKPDYQTVIRNGIPDEWIKTELLSNHSLEDTFNLLYVGRFERSKGTDVALQVVNYLVHQKEYKNTHLDLYGRGDEDYVNGLKAYVMKNGLSSNISFNPFLPRDELIKKYSDYHVLLFTTPEFETSSNVILEAMAQGVLVVSTSIGATREIIQDNYDGFLVPPDDPASMAQVVEKIFISYSEMSKVRDRALKKVREHYSVSRMINDYEICLQEFKRLMT